MEDTIAEIEGIESEIQQKAVIAMLVVGVVLLIGAVAWLVQRRSMQGVI